VSQQWVSKWQLKGLRITTDGKVQHLPKATQKVDPKEKPVIAERAKKDTQEQIAADYGVNKSTISRIVTAETKKAEAAKKRKAAAKAIKGNAGIFVGDFREVGKKVADNSVSLIFTDPPYDKEAAALYADLAAFANRVLRPGGWCLAYSGQAHLPEVFDGMTDHLTYGWTFAIQHTGGDLRFRKYKLQNKWKPIVGFFKPPLGTITWDWFPDMATGGKEKDDHEWQQAESEAAHFIEAMTLSGELVCDPFCGSGTTCVASKRLKRKWIAIEIDKNTAEKAKGRVTDV
jgi:DNA modification methylase